MIMLTMRELEVSDLLLQGLTNNEIADKLNIVEKTVRFHLGNMYRKFGVKDRFEYVALFVDKSYLDQTKKAIKYEELALRQAYNKNPKYTVLARELKMNHNDLKRKLIDYNIMSIDDATNQDKLSIGNQLSFE